MLIVSCSGGFTVNLGIDRITSCVMTRALPMKFAASHTYIPESSTVVLTIVRFPFLEKLRLAGRLENTRDHVMVGEGNPDAMHFGKVISFPSMTYMERSVSGLMRGVAKRYKHVTKIVINKAAFEVI